MENKENKDTRGLGLRKNQSSGKTPPKGKSWFFGIGINNYAEFSDLNNAVNDIESIQKLLVDKYDIESDCAITILNEDATRENIIDQLDVLVKKIQADDKLIIYYSGHGHLNKNTDRGYWIPHDARKGKTAKYIRNSTIRDFIKDLKARHVLLISDSCFSGTLFVRGANRSSAAVDELETIPSRWAICSGRHDEEVYDGKPGENSPFAISILETLSRNEKPVFNVVKLADRVVEQTRSNYKQLPEGNPLYDVGHKGGQYIFHLKKDEAADWKECVEKRTIAAFNAFVVKYPDGKYTADARAELKSIKATELWKQIDVSKDGNLIETNKKLKLINQYVDEFENQPDYEKVLDLGQLLDYKKQFFQAQSSEFAIRKFLRRSVPNVEGASEIFANAKQLLQHIDTESNLKRKAEEDRLAELERTRLAKEEEIAKQKGKEKQQQIEQNRLAEEARKAKYQKEVQFRKQQAELKQKQNIKQADSSKKSPNQKKKYGLFAGLAIVGLIVVIFIIRAFTGGSSKTCSDPVQPFKDSSGKMGLKQCKKIIYPAKFDFIFLFAEGLAVVQDEQKFGFIDEKGSYVINPVYDRAESFAEGRALVFLNGNKFFIDKNGTCIENCPDEIDKTKDNKKNDNLIDNNNQKDTENKYKNLIELAVTNLKKGELVFNRQDYARAQRYYEVALKSFSEAIGLVKDDRKAQDGKKRATVRLDEIEKIKNTPPAKKYTTDKRSGYREVRLVGKTWLAENLTLKVSSSWCYNSEDANCDKFGRLYTWEAAKKACRALGSGWRLPKKHEWNDLNDNNNITTLNVLLGGKRTIKNGTVNFNELNRIGYYWHAAEDNSDNAFKFELKKGYLRFGDLMYEKDNGFSCRCIKD